MDVVASLTVSVLFVQAIGGGEPRGGGGAETEDRAAPEGAEEGAAGQQHDTSATLLQVCCFTCFLRSLCMRLCVQLDAAVTHVFPCNCPAPNTQRPPVKLLCLMCSEQW